MIWDRFTGSNEPPEDCPGCEGNGTAVRGGPCAACGGSGNASDVANRARLLRTGDRAVIAFGPNAVHGTVEYVSPASSPVHLIEVACDDGTGYHGDSGAAVPLYEWQQAQLA